MFFKTSTSELQNNSGRSQGRCQYPHNAHEQNKAQEAYTHVSQYLIINQMGFSGEP